MKKYFCRLWQGIVDDSFALLFTELLKIQLKVASQLIHEKAWQSFIEKNYLLIFKCCKC